MNKGPRFVETMGKRRWWICPKCGTRNWLDRMHNPKECTKCHTSYAKRSFWPAAVRQWILRRDGRACTIYGLRKILNPSLAQFLGPCQGKIQVIHCIPRHHGGKMDEPQNGITVCTAHADLLIHGRRRARQEYTRDVASFGDWHFEYLYISFARLPRLVREIRFALYLVACERECIAKK